MARRIIIVLLVVLIFPACTDVMECSSPSDCEGREHIDCIGDWLCRNDKCSWYCMDGGPGLNESLVLMNGSVNESQVTVNDTIVEPECLNDTDCVIGGCSGQLCSTPEVIGELDTTCEWMLQYECLKRTTCDCLNGSCGWRINDEYLLCMKDYEDNRSRFSCELDSDCIPEECCHPTTCINVDFRLNCSDANCSESCESVLDCSRGECVCFDNECVVKRR